MSGCSVPYQHNAFTFSAMLFGKLIKKSLHTGGVESRQHQPERAPRSWMSRGKEPQPFVARINDGKWPLANGCPDAAKYWLESEARFVFTPDFHFLRRVLLLKGLSRKL